MSTTLDDFLRRAADESIRYYTADTDPEDFHDVDGWGNDWEGEFDELSDY